MDENIMIKKYRLQTKTMKMKLIDDYRLIEEATK
jgi:hypothetical protein